MANTAIPSVYTLKRESRWLASKSVTRRLEEFGLILSDYLIREHKVRVTCSASVCESECYQVKHWIRLTNLNVVYVVHIILNTQLLQISSVSRSFRQKNPNILLS